MFAWGAHLCKCQKITANELINKACQYFGVLDPEDEGITVSQMIATTNTV